MVDEDRNKNHDNHHNLIDQDRQYEPHLINHHIDRNNLLDGQIDQDMAEEADDGDANIAAAPQAAPQPFEDLIIVPNHQIQV